MMASGTVTHIFMIFSDFSAEDDTVCHNMYFSVVRALDSRHAILPQAQAKKLRQGCNPKGKVYD